MPDSSGQPTAEELAAQYNRLKNINAVAEGQQSYEDAGVDLVLGAGAALIGLGLAWPVIASVIHWNDAAITLGVRGLALFTIGSVSCLGWGLPKFLSGLSAKLS